MSVYLCFDNPTPPQKTWAQVVGHVLRLGGTHYFVLRIDSKTVGMVPLLPTAVLQAERHGNDEFVGERWTDLGPLNIPTT